MAEVTLFILDLRADHQGDSPVGVQVANSMSPTATLASLRCDSVAVRMLSRSTPVRLHGCPDAVPDHSGATPWQSGCCPGALRCDSVAVRVLSGSTPVRLRGCPDAVPEHSGATPWQSGCCPGALRWDYAAVRVLSRSTPVRLCDCPGAAPDHSRETPWLPGTVREHSGETMRLSGCCPGALR